MNGKTVVVFGGGSGIGEATAAMAKGAGARVVVVGRDERRLSDAAVRLGEGVETVVADATKPADIDRVFAHADVVDHVVIAVTGKKGAGPFADLDLGVLRQAFEEKTFAQIAVAQAAAKRLRGAGSITFVTAASARSVLRGTAGVAAVNGALEVIVPILAAELAPLRVNAVSPGIIDTEWWSNMPAEMKGRFFRAAEQSLPVQRVGRPEEVAAAIALVMQNDFITGAVYHVDGGNRLVRG